MGIEDAIFLRAELESGLGSAAEDKVKKPGAGFVHFIHAPPKLSGLLR